jgi:hypothetical protein
MEGAPLQVYPVSISQRLEHPSPFAPFPSSQGSSLGVPEGSQTVSRAPLPQRGGVNVAVGSRPQPMRSCPFQFQCGFLPSGYGPPVANCTATSPPGVVRNVDAVGPSKVGCVSSDWM